MSFEAIRLLASIFSFLVVFGFCTNSLIILTTVRTKTLHNPCNILIAFCAFADILHLLGHLSKIIPIFEGTVEISSYTCGMLQAGIIPHFGLSSGVSILLLIAIDRFISVNFPTFYFAKNTSRYMTCHILAIIAYAALQYAFAYFFFDQRHGPVVCNPPEIYHGLGRDLWGITSITVILVAVIIFYIVWRKLARKAELAKSRRIFRSILAVMFSLIIGWLLTMSIYTVEMVALDLRGRSLYIGVDIAGIPANITMTLNCIVLYVTSIEYRTAFRKQLRAIPLIGRLFPATNKITFTFETTIYLQG